MSNLLDLSAIDELLNTYLIHYSLVQLLMNSFLKLAVEIDANLQGFIDIK